MHKIQQDCLNSGFIRPNWALSHDENGRYLSHDSTVYLKLVRESAPQPVIMYGGFGEAWDPRERRLKNAWETRKDPWKIDQDPWRPTKNPENQENSLERIKKQKEEATRQAQELQRKLEQAEEGRQIERNNREWSRQRHTEDKRHTRFAVGAVLASVILFILISIAIWFIIKKRRMAGKSKMKPELLPYSPSADGPVRLVGHTPVHQEMPPSYESAIDLKG